MAPVRALKRAIRFLIFIGSPDQQKAFYREVHAISVGTQVFGALCWVLSLLTMDHHDGVSLPWASGAVAGMVIGIGITYLGRTLPSTLYGGALTTLSVALGYRLLIAGIAEPTFWVLPLGMLITLTLAPILSSTISYLCLFAGVWCILGAGYFPLHSRLDDHVWPTLAVSASLMIGLSLNVSFMLLRIQSYHAQKHLKKMAYTDVLTGMNNRRKFTDLATDMLQRPAATGRYFFMIDIDDFKQINDTQGHDVGDEVLRAAAAAITACSAGQLCGRLGGEEFGVIFDGGREAAHAFASDLLRAVSRPHPLAGVTSVSIGMADMVAGEALASAYKRADEALYLAKGAGKNQYHYGGPATSN